VGVIDDILDLSKAEAEKPDLHDRGIAPHR
jgi:hypothetical protein